MKIELKSSDGKRFEIDLHCAVVKIGSAVITQEFGKLNRGLVYSYARVINELYEKGARVVIVSSGAVSAGIGEMQSKRYPQAIPEKQALASIGQSKLMKLYSEAFGKYGRKVGQILLTRADMDDRRRYLNTRYTLEMLFKMGVVPIVNENDTTTIDELKFGDNDLLSAIVATKLEAELLVMLTVVDGLCYSVPKPGKPAQLIPLVERLTPEIKNLACDSRTELGSGGMHTKLQAVEYAALGGVYSVITNGKRRGILEKIFSGEIEGTLFLPVAGRKRLSKRQRWIAFGKAGRGRKLIIDAGASQALLRKGKSLLPVGIKDVIGEFERGDVVEIYDEKGTFLGKGLVNYTSEEVKKIKGHHTSEIPDLLGHRDYDEVVHRDNFVLLVDR
ncbi:glutamate 5-kinase [Candidatus Sumerlaeota bacterium]|nr:glutamate 5-kinase [Candidatus Sumerlaeota bacterium]